MKDRVALVTGSTRGLGLAIAAHLAGQGARVALNYAHDDSAASKALQQVQARGQASLYKADVLGEEGAGGLVRRVAREMGPIDILIVNATPPQRNCRIDEYTDEDFRSMMDAFLMSPHYLTRAVMGPMKERRFGRIIHITSEVFYEPPANYSAYIGAKGAQIGYLRSSAIELAPHGITVNAVAPGWIPVERHAHLPKPAFEPYVKMVPLGRVGTPQEVAAAVGYFASDDAGFVTGQTLAVNGGRTLF